MTPPPAINGSGHASRAWWKRSLESHSRRASSASARSRNSFRSKPAEKKSPAPVMTIALTAVSRPNASTASLTSSRSAIDRAFFFSGRASVIVATPVEPPLTWMSAVMRSSMPPAAAGRNRAWRI